MLLERVRLAAAAPIRLADTGDVDVGSTGAVIVTSGRPAIGGVRVENHSASA